MRKLALIFLLALLMTCTNGNADEWNRYISGTIANGPAILHKSAHSSSMPLARLLDGDTAILFDAYGGWYYVLEPNSGLQGWIRRENFQPNDASAKAPRRGIVLCETLTLRQTPSTSSKKLSTLQTQQQVLILEEQDEWYFVQFMEPNSRTKGYVLKDFITQDFSSRIVMDEPIYAYAAPSSGSKKVALIDVGTQVYIIDTYEDFWIISLRGASAFVSMKDLQIYY